MLVVLPVPFTPTTRTIAGLGSPCTGAACCAPASCAVGATFRSPANASPPSPHNCPFAAPFTSSVARDAPPPAPPPPPPRPPAGGVRVWGGGGGRPPPGRGGGGGGGGGGALPPHAGGE